MIFIVDWLFAFFAVILFLLPLKILSVSKRVKEIVGKSKDAYQIIADIALSDFEKEKAVQACAVKLFRELFKLFQALGFAVILPVIFVGLSVYFGVLSVSGFVGVSLSWQFFLVTTFFGFFWVYIDSLRQKV